MIDALGAPQSLMLLGGTSDIALAVGEEYLRRSPGLRVVLAGRESDAREAARQRLATRGASVEVLNFDASEPVTHPDIVGTAFSGGDIDVAVVAFGVLGEEEGAWQSHHHAVELAQINYTGSVSVGVCLADRMRAQGHGAIVALSSVAGERVRRSNFVYGSTKAGMDGFYLGLGDALREDGVHVLVVRPGFVRTKMTAGRNPAPLATTPEHVAQSIVDGVARRRTVVWVPGALRPVMSVLRHVPQPVFRKLPL